MSVPPVDRFKIQRHIEFIRSLVELKLWFVRHWQHRHPGESFTSIIRNRVNLFGQTCFWDASLSEDVWFQDIQWREIEMQLEENLMFSKDSFERKGIEVIWPFVLSDIEKRLQQRTDFSTFQAGSLRYVITTNPKRIAVHFANARMPQSSFDDEEYIVGCFLKMIEKAENEGAEELECSSWLNMFPRWLDFFPSEYLSHLGEIGENVNRYQSWWGQFQTASGDFHHKNANYLKHTGNFRYQRRHSWCSFTAMRRHLVGAGTLRRLLDSPKSA